MANAQIDFPIRLGAPPKDKHKIRPVLVSFVHQSDRNKILYRKHPECPITIKADLPPETAAKQQILGQLTRWAKGENIDVKRTVHYVEMKGARYNHIEAKEFLEACVLNIATTRKISNKENHPGRPKRKT